MEEYTITSLHFHVVAAKQLLKKRHSLRIGHSLISDPLVLHSTGLVGFGNHLCSGIVRTTPDEAGLSFSHRGVEFYLQTTILLVYVIHSYEYRTHIRKQASKIIPIPMRRQLLGYCG